MVTNINKLFAIVLTGGLLLTLGTATVLAANSNDTDISKTASVFTLTGDENTSLGVKEVDGIRSYSTDDGKTWSETIPEGLVEQEIDPESFLTEGESSVSVRVDEDGTPSYSTDGEKTWSKEAPEGVTITVGENEIGVISGEIGN